MDHHSIIDQNPASVEGAGTSEGRSATASVSAGIAAANAHLPKLLETEPRFPGEDGGQSLAKMAQLDLDAALQLLAERAQYITGASGAAIALRRGEHSDMLCRASAGSNAPELGALLSMEYGLSGESVRTRQALRCDDAAQDRRVNRESCRQLGIASVVVMPIVSEKQVLGVFELFSGKPYAFEERDLSALRRLGEMVETAVRHAEAARGLAAVEEPAGGEGQPFGEVIAAQAWPIESPENVIAADCAVVPQGKGTLSTKLEKTKLEKTKLEKTELEKTELEKTELEKTELEKTEPEPAPKKPLFWSAVFETPASADRPDDIAASITLPMELKNLQRCQACGFPVSQGRTFCVDCEGKQWRGDGPPQPAAAAVAAGQEAPQTTQPEPLVIGAQADTPEISVLKGSSSVQTSDPAMEPSVGEIAMAAPVVVDLPQSVPHNVPEDVSDSDNSILFLSSAAPSESWFAAHKYILGALLVVAIVIGALVWLR
jgi:GAF domain